MQMFEDYAAANEQPEMASFLHEQLERFKLEHNLNGSTELRFGDDGTFQPALF